MDLTRKQVGTIGESIVSKFLTKRGFKVLALNYWKKWGEIDIIAQKKGALHFVEVKTVSCENFDSAIKQFDRYRPEDNVHPWKLRKLHRTIETYLSEKNVEGEWQLDMACVYLDFKNKKAKVFLTENIVG